jgi:hypothetical protein
MKLKQKKQRFGYDSLNLNGEIGLLKILLDVALNNWLQLGDER